MGLRGGCLAEGMVRVLLCTVCYYYLRGCSALVMCARHARLAWGVVAGAGSCVSPWAPPCPRVPRGACCEVSLSSACWYAIPCGLCVPWDRSGCPSGPRRLSVACVCALSPAAYAPPPPPGSVWCAHYARFRCRAPVGPLQAVCAPPRFLRRSRAPPI